MFEKFETDAEIYHHHQDDSDIFHDDDTDTFDERFTSEERDDFSQDSLETYDNVPQPTFDEIDSFIDSLALKVNELECIAEESEEVASKDSSDSVTLTDTMSTRSRRSGSILKHPGQKRTHIKHVEFLDVITDDSQNCDNVRYF